MLAEVVVKSFLFFTLKSTGAAGIIKISALSKFSFIELYISHELTGEEELSFL